MELIPSIDLRGGRVVRLEQGDYARETVYDADPVRQAQRFAAAGVARIHIVDLDAARDGDSGNQAVIRAILDACRGTRIQLGGGMRSRARIDAALAAGAERVVVGTAALEQPELVREAARAHPGRLVLGLDARGGRVAVRGWLETSALTPGEVLARFSGVPFAAVLHTEIGRDGLLQGPDVEGTAQLARSTELPVIASGGVGTLGDLERLARTRVIAAAIVGRALYSGAIELPKALARLAAC
ncbi:MAG TPA: 1-(5-phosphoribosyl)-5-[(5-phosphoribosylamino)methylideneamino]imidazole-4-carboxamide isomerase [Myxococcota bacterium]|nr:1-(5-phosphoribosyl)-5-[(5-phosphoribosylamino)methylideneamino]imidazole-4-carboxamide isomerase [Myxococcota bacterium]